MVNGDLGPLDVLHEDLRDLQPKIVQLPNVVAVKILVQHTMLTNVH